MTISMADVGRRARMDVTFASRRERTVIADAYCEVPFKITRLHSGRFPDVEHLILVHSTAGVFGGDNLEATISVQSGARVLLTQQSATKVHPCDGRIASISNRIRVDRGGELHLYCEPVIPFADSRLSQTTSIEVQPGGRFLLWESFMAGRIGSGESWQFAELAVETRINSGEHLIYLDRFQLVPTAQSPTTRWTLGGSGYSATGLYFGEDAARFAAGLHEAIPGAGVDTPADGLAAIRFVCGSGPELQRCRDLFQRQGLVDSSI